MAEIIFTSIASFASTNIDDIFILMVLYARNTGRKGRWKIAAGQYLGMGILMGLSVLGAAGTRILPREYIRFLGILPICLGIKAWLEYKDGTRMENGGKGAAECTGDGTLEQGRKKMSQDGTDVAADISIPSAAMITIANGADNVGVYTPLFSTYSASGLLVTAGVFAVMTALWCMAGLRLADYPLVRDVLRRYQHILVPAVLIGLGLFILF